MDFEKYLDKAIELGTNAVNQHGQQAWDTILWLQRLSSIQMLLIAFIGIIFLYASYFFGKKTRVTYEEDYGSGFVPAYAIASGVCGVIGAICATEFLNVWNWVGLFYPELALAKQALDAVMK